MTATFILQTKNYHYQPVFFVNSVHQEGIPTIPSIFFQTVIFISLLQFCSDNQNMFNKAKQTFQSSSFHGIAYPLIKKELCQMIQPVLQYLNQLKKCLQVCIAIHQNITSEDEKLKILMESLILHLEQFLRLDDCAIVQICKQGPQIQGGNTKIPQQFYRNLLLLEVAKKKLKQTDNDIQRHLLRSLGENESQFIKQNMIGEQIKKERLHFQKLTFSLESIFSMPFEIKLLQLRDQPIFQYFPTNFNLENFSTLLSQNNKSLQKLQICPTVFQIHCHPFYNSRDTQKINIRVPAVIQELVSKKMCCFEQEFEVDDEQSIEIEVQLEIDASQLQKNQFLKEIRKLQGKKQELAQNHLKKLQISSSQFNIMVNDFKNSRAKLERTVQITSVSSEQDLDSQKDDSINLTRLKYTDSYLDSSNDFSRNLESLNQQVNPEQYFQLLEEKSDKEEENQKLIKKLDEMERLINEGQEHERAMHEKCGKIENEKRQMMRSSQIMASDYKQRMGQLSLLNKEREDENIELQKKLSKCLEQIETLQSSLQIKSQQIEEKQIKIRELGLDFLKKIKEYEQQLQEKIQKFSDLQRNLTQEAQHNHQLITLAQHQNNQLRTRIDLLENQNCNQNNQLQELSFEYKQLSDKISEFYDFYLESTQQKEQILQNLIQGEIISHEYQQNSSLHNVRDSHSKLINLLERMRDRQIGQLLKVEDSKYLRNQLVHLRQINQQKQIIIQLMHEHLRSQSSTIYFCKKGAQKSKSNSLQIDLYNNKAEKCLQIVHTWSHTSPPQKSNNLGI